ncbi:MAG: alpha/beta hydrolase [Mariprofundaceae bacterium]|nr:alpha/beta hydrolase [Mariprofundaceae bacterium]
MSKARVVLLRGMFGFSRILWWEYFHGAPKLLAAMGFEVRVPATPWGESIERRAAFLAEALKDCAGPLHLIAHSMGGLDARHYITHLCGHAKVASLTTISTPHHGSTLATQALSSPLSLWKHIPAVADLSLASMTRFNKNTPDMPGVIYRSYSAARPLSGLPWWIRPYGRRISIAEGANDSLVSVSSSAWGEHIATLQADHFELIGSHVWLNPFRRRVPFKHLPLYRDIGEWIQHNRST